jgi:hypothetical protein
MKAIVADLISTSILCCLIANSPVWADLPVKQSTQPKIPLFWSARVLTENDPLMVPLDPNLAVLNLDDALLVEEPNYIHTVINLDTWVLSNENSILNQNSTTYETLSASKSAFSHQTERADVTLGFHNNFWSSRNQNNSKYWGLTAVELWGDTKTELQQKPNSNINSEVLLPKGVSALTLSGGGNNNLVQQQNSLGEFEDFRGGVAFHRGVAKDVTLGLGFVYEDLPLGYTQLSYQPTNSPLKTSISLIGGDEGLVVNSHVRFQPSGNFVLNFYNKDSEQKFDLNWGLGSSLTLVAKGDTHNDSLNAGVKYSLRGDDFLVSASAGWDTNKDWQWQFDSRFGRLGLIYASDREKINSELNYIVFKPENFGFQCSLFLNYENRLIKSKEEYLTSWGWRLHSGEKLGQNKYRWEFDLGYGIGSQGSGLVASAVTALTPELFLKLGYQNMSLTSDDSSWTFQLTTK